MLNPASFRIAERVSLGISVSGWLGYTVCLLEEEFYHIPLLPFAYRSKTKIFRLAGPGRTPGPGQAPSWKIPDITGTTFYKAWESPGKEPSLAYPEEESTIQGEHEAYNPYDPRNHKQVFQKKKICLVTPGCKMILEDGNISWLSC